MSTQELGQPLHGKRNLVTNTPELTPEQTDLVEALQLRKHVPTHA